MQVRSLWIVLAVLIAPVPVRAQHGGGAAAAPAVKPAPREAAQFNFLVGQWELDVHPVATTLAQKIHGMPKIVGTWKGWRGLDGYGIEDEMRITDKSGNPMSLTHAVRYYDANAKRWSSMTLDVYRGTFNPSSAEWRNGEMIVMGRGTDRDGKTYMARSTYSKITAGSFRFTQERSTDNGKSWKESLTIDAKRVAATASR
jgi:hypothetical protein